VTSGRQALNALLFLYREVLDQELLCPEGLQRPNRQKRIPTVLSREEFAALLDAMDQPMRLVARLLYGTGMRRWRHLGCA
jgi:integrase